MLIANSRQEKEKGRRLALASRAGKRGQSSLLTLNQIGKSDGGSSKPLTRRIVGMAADSTVTDRRYRRCRHTLRFQSDR
jgi:hypothetical protein